ncbi:MAG: HAD hydrolase-like protein, partial [Candidatus Altarchaeaceae archaeon]
MIGCILFDLDGTLVDSYDSIVKAFKEAFKFLESKNFEIPYKTDAEIRKLIGIPHSITFKKICNSDELTLKAAEIFRETRMKENVKLMDHTIEILKFLKEKNIKEISIDELKKICEEKNLNFGIVFGWLKKKNYVNLKNGKVILIDDKEREDEILIKLLPKEIEKEDETINLLKSRKILEIKERKEIFVSITNEGIKEKICEYEEISQLTPE